MSKKRKKRKIFAPLRCGYSSNADKLKLNKAVDNKDGWTHADGTTVYEHHGADGTVDLTMDTASTLHIDTTATDAITLILTTTGN